MIVAGFIPSPLDHITEYVPTAPEIAITVGVYAVGGLVLTALYKVVLSVRENAVGLTRNVALAPSRHGTRRERWQRNDNGTPLLDELEKGSWPSFVTQIKEMADEGKEQCQQLLELLERSYREKIGHWKHGGIVGVHGYGGGVIGRYNDLQEEYPGHRPLPHAAREHAQRVVLHLGRVAHDLRHLGRARLRAHQHARLHGGHHPPGHHDG